MCMVSLHDLFSESCSLIYMTVDDPFTDSWCSHIDIKPPSPSPERHLPLAPILETHGEEELTASSTASSNPPPFMLSPYAKENSSAEQHPPAIPPAIPLAPNPVHYQCPFIESNPIPKQHPPVVLPPPPLPPNPAHYQYPLSYLPYPLDMYHGDPCTVYGVHHPRDFPHDAGQFGPAIFPGIPYPDPQMHLASDPARPVTRSSSVEPRQLHHPSTEAK